MLDTSIFPIEREHIPCNGGSEKFIIHIEKKGFHEIEESKAKNSFILMEKGNFS